MAGETPIGGIVGFLRMEADQFHREIERAIAEVEVLDGKRVRVDMDTSQLERAPRAARQAASGLDETERSARRLQDATDRLNVATLKLSELNESGKAKGSQIVAARQALARAQRDERDAIYATYEANINLGKSQDAATLSADKAAGAHERSRKAARGHRMEVGALATAIVALGPAAIPLAAGATALSAAFAGMGAAGVLAVVGVMREMKAGTVVGESYRATLGGAKADLSELASVAAGNVLGPLQDAVRDLDERMPALSGQIGELSTVTGKTAGALAGGLLSAFQSLEPLMRDASVYILDLSTRFQAAMSGPGIVSFGDYVRSVFPQVMQDIESIVGAAVHLVEALAPLGLGTLGALRTLSDLISAIPADKLAVIAELATGVFLGFKAWQLLSVPINGLIGMLGGVEAMSTRAATAVRGLQAAAGIVGIAIAALSYLFTVNAEETRNNEQAVNDYADALRRSNGVVDESIRQMTAKKLADEGVLDVARQYGINLADVTEAALGNADAQARVNARLAEIRGGFAEANSAGGDLGATFGDVGGDLGKLEGAIGRTNGQLDSGIQKQKDIAAATQSAAGETSNAAIAAQHLADTYGTSATTFSNVATAQQKLADKAAAATLQMQLENNAAGLLKQSLDLLNGENMDLAQATNSFERGKLNLASPIDQAKEQLAAAQKRAAEVAADKGTTSGGGSSAARKAALSLTQAQDNLARVQANGKATANQLASAQDRVETATLRLSEAQKKAGKVTGASTQAQKDSANAAVAEAKAHLAAQFALQGQSEEAVRNRGTLLNLASGAALVAEKFGDQKDSAEAGRLKLIELRDQIIKNAVAQGMNKDEVTKFINEVLKIPATVPPTKADLDIAAALKKKKALQDAINAITGKTVTMTIQQVYQTVGSVAARAVHNEQTLDRHGHNLNLAQGALWSGGVRKMAQGDISGSHQSMIMRSTKPILWNEAPGGEAFISLAPQQRARSLAIHDEVGKLIGARRGESKSVTQNLTFHTQQAPSPKAISRELAWEARG